MSKQNQEKSVHELSDLFDHVKEIIERRVDLVITEFMSTRGTKKPTRRDFSDLTVQRRTRKGGLTIEWGYRLWNTKASAVGRYRLIYLPRKKVLLYAQEWEVGEVNRTRAQLGALIDAHKKLRRVEAQLGKFGLLGRDEDILAGFIPEWKSPAVGVMSKAGRDDGDE